MRLRILSPEKSVFDEEIESVTVPGSTGSFQVLKGHAPILSSLVPGRVKVMLRNRELTFSVSGGYFEFSQEQAVVLADSVESP